MLYSGYFRTVDPGMILEANMPDRATLVELTCLLALLHATRAPLTVLVHAGGNSSAALSSWLTPTEDLSMFLPMIYQFDIQPLSPVEGSENDTEGIPLLFA